MKSASKAQTTALDLMARVARKSVLACAMACAALTSSPATSAPVNGLQNPSSQDVPLVQGDGEFKSIAASRVNMRAAPRQTALVQWVYIREGLPILVTESYDNWLKVKDPDGASGWIREDMLSDRRTVLITERTRTMFDRPRPDADAVFQVEAGNIGTVRICEGAWCRITIGAATGWILRNYIWGTFAGENFDQ